MSSSTAPETHGKESPWHDGLGRTSIRASQILLVFALIAVLGFALTKVTLVVIPVLLALIFSAAIAPAVKWLMSKGWPSVAATTASFVAMILVFGGIIAGIVIAVKNEWGELASHASEGFDQLYAYVKEGPIPVDDKVINDAKNTVMDFLSSSNFSSGALTGLSAVSSFAAGFVLMAVVLFYFLKDGVHIWQFFLSYLKGERLRKATLAGTRTMEVLGGYVRGTSIVAAVDAVFIGGALFILQVPLALPLAVLTFIGAFIPLVGATAAGAFAVLIALVSNGPGVALLVLIVVIVVNQLEGNFLQPVLMGKSLNVHGLVILLALTIGTILAGIIGAVLSVPFAAVTWAVIKVWRNEDTGDDTATPGVNDASENADDETPEAGPVEAVVTQ